MMKILSLNLTTSWTTSRKSRMLQIRQFIEDNGVDIVLFQEGLQSCWPIYNSLRNLCPKDWWCYSKGYIGFPWFCSWRVGVLSRYEILSTASLNCEIPQLEWLDALPYPGRKRAVSVTVDVPGLGTTTLVSVHLTSSPKTEADRASQFLKLHGWISGLPPADVWICGGDFNCNQYNSAFASAFGAEGVTGEPPDYICVDGAKITKGYPVLTGKVVTDHDAGILAEMEKA